MNWNLVKKTSTCWLWVGAKHRLGYGWVSYQGRASLAHRVAYSVLVAQIPDGLSVLHRCDVRACVNPDHLFLGTHADNMADMARKGRRCGPKNRGESNPMARLNDEAAREVRCLSRLGVPQRWTAEMYGVSQSAVSFVASNKSWRES